MYFQNIFKIIINSIIEKYLKDIGFKDRKTFFRSRENDIVMQRYALITALYEAFDYGNTRLSNAVNYLSKQQVTNALLYTKKAMNTPNPNYHILINHYNIAKQVITSFKKRIEGNIQKTIDEIQAEW